MTNFVYIATSLDGFIASQDGGIDWLMEVPNPDNNDFGFSEFMEKIDAIVIGRKTFEKVLSFEKWPYAKPVFILSDRLNEVPEYLKNRAEIVRGDIRKLIEELDTRGYRDLYIDGGKVIRSFLQEDLIDEMIITRVPIILGNGIPLFTQLDLTLRFKHEKTVTFNNYLVKTHYKRAR